MKQIARGESPGSRALTVGITSGMLLVLQACDLATPPAEPPFVKVSIAADTVVASSEVLPTASVPISDGVPEHPLTWSTTAGSIEPVDEHYLAVMLRAPDEPGEVTVTVTLESDPPVQDSVDLIVEPAPEPEPSQTPNPTPSPSPSQIRILSRTPSP